MSPEVLPAPADKAAYVQGMFDRIAIGYDRVNDWMTGGLHRLWKRQLVRGLRPAPGDAALDLATGTGDLALLLQRAVGPEGRTVGLDFSAGMLEIARARRSDGIEWLQGDMLALPFPDASFDVVTVGFGLRNVADLERALKEIARILKPGGRFGSLETARPRQAWMRAVVALHSRLAPWLGRWMAGDDDAYRYLHASALAFVDQDTLAHTCRQVGLADVVVRDLSGGALALVMGKRVG
ncbi:MAG: bifunctional demethylmenaquinone methyltransferase/2-methoxy-6-polyprenyl-1,4-benzoquinol methylase UbiE [Candidatus Sericytochromatia bacterium]|nr:bifunctional demethylmenaquinone methyltransferase/2-methoxy-6-polyprenyl-1,4-benzoquinol methylase UbiE [Candidatus Sericytochromatia bacterium]